MGSSVGLGTILETETGCGKSLEVKETLQDSAISESLLILRQLVI